MTESLIYRSKDMLDEQFPFKIEVRSLDNMNRLEHAHEHLQLCYMLSGGCLHWAGGKPYALTKGDLFSIPPFQAHRLEPRDGMAFEMIQVDFMPHAINESFRDLARMPTFVDFAYIRPLIHEEDLLPKMALPPAVQAEAETLLHSILREWKEQEEGYRLAIKADLLKLLVIIGRQYARSAHKQEHRKVELHREAFYRAIAYMESHYQEDLHLEEVAAMALMAPSYFSNMLRLVRGKSYIELLSSIRIQAAMELLSGTDLSITDIAARSGYNHISHFNRTFKKHTGVTPGDFRKHRS